MQNFEQTIADLIAEQSKIYLEDGASQTDANTIAAEDIIDYLKSKYFYQNK